MTTYEVTFPLFWLRALRLLAPTKDVRKYLNGVAIAHGYLAATDGRAVGALRDEMFDGLPEVIIPNNALDPFLRAAKAYLPDADVTVQFMPTTADDSRLCTPGILTLDTAQQGFLASEGKYPYIPNALLPAPGEVKGYSQFQWPYLVLFEKAAEALGAPKEDRYKIHMTLRSDNAARVRILCVPKFDGILMPLRDTFTEF